MEALVQAGLQSQRGLLDVLIKTAKWVAPRNAIDLAYAAKAVEGSSPSQAGQMMALLVRYVNEVFKAQALLPDALGRTTELAVRALDRQQGAVEKFIAAVEKRRLEPPEPEPEPEYRAPTRADLEKEKEREKREKEKEKEKEKKSKESGGHAAYDFVPPKDEGPKSPLRWAVPLAVLILGVSIYVLRSGGAAQDTNELPPLADVNAIVKLTEVRRSGPLLTGRIADLKWREMTVDERTDAAKRVFAKLKAKGLKEMKFVDGTGGEGMSATEAGVIKVSKVAPIKPAP